MAEIMYVKDYDYVDKYVKYTVFLPYRNINKNDLYYMYLDDGLMEIC